jgi:plastocyanin
MRSLSLRYRRVGIAALIVTLTIVIFASGTAVADVDSVIQSDRVSGAWRWKPRHDYIARGDTVRWRVPGGQNTWHDVHAYGGNWSFSVARLDPGEGRNRRFTSTGAFKYRCVRHSAKPPGEKCQGMCGTVHVINP